MPGFWGNYAQGDEKIMNYKLQISNRAHKAPLCVSMGELSWRYAKHGAMTEGAGSRN